ncbi:hypothetical protein [Sorangium sp. So ce693]|uniref:hypothetical protein n=1 Tax=Sorangium sp. So ce693 TaxID=3133318 RepID=UPI003F5E9B9C
MGVPLVRRQAVEPGHRRQRGRAAALFDADMAIGEVAYLLGYSEPRAFRRWTGVRPEAFRARTRGAAPR